ncbi:MAG TPA: vWA domain-containing protein [Planctomycetota bacterium]|nr:vWA domain-containing protein [Planctomycetota bacterium]
MSGWLRALLGVENTDIPDGAVTSFEFANLPRGSAGLALLLLALALVAGVFWIYRREGSAPGPLKITLASLRALVIACAFILILEPVLAIDQVEEIDKSTLLLLDGSLSMTSRDRYPDEATWAALRNAIAKDPRELPRYRIVNEALDTSGLITMLARSNRVVVQTFSDTVSAPVIVPRLEKDAIPPQAPGIDLVTDAARARAVKGTNLSGSVRQAVEMAGSDRVAAIIVVTDGRNNLGPPPEDLALYLRNKDLRLFTVVVGEAELPRNLRVTSLAGPDRIFRNDPAVFEARASSRGYNSATVEFWRRYPEAGDAWDHIATEHVDFPPGDQPAILRVTDRPPRTGLVEYRAQIEPATDESDTKDNEKIFVTRVVEEKAKVLLVAGAPAYDYYAIKNTLMRDSTITLACFLESADPNFRQDGNVSITELPKEEKDLFAYDVVILHDPDPSVFPPDWPAMLKKFVSDHGGGLAFIAGNKFTLSLLRDTPSGENDLSGLLPVVLDTDRADQPGIGIGYGGYFTSPWRMAPDPAGLSHPATRFHSDPKQAKELVWDRLPPFYWCFPVLKAKPGATVLARHDDPRETVEPYGRRPVLAVHRYGAGRVLFLAADETHRWRATAENIFDRFWVQTTRFLLEGRLGGARKRFRVYLDRELVDLGDAVRISAEAFDASFEPLQAPSVSVTLNGPSLEQELKLEPVEGKPGHFAGSFAPPAVGDYELRATAAEFKGEGPDTPAASFRAEEPHREMGDVRTDRPLLRDLAARTRGIATEVYELGKLGDPHVIPPASERVVTQGRPVPLWDTWTTVIVVLLLVCAEWILRKRYRMV